jgi:hypothetical protein
MQENEKQEIQVNKKAKELKELKEQPKIKVFTQELKTQFTRAAFQQEVNNRIQGNTICTNRNNLYHGSKRNQFN